MKRVFIFLISAVSIMSCSDKKDPLGKWDDVIQLSEKNFRFDAAGDSVTITTKGEWWWINNVKVNNEYVDLNDPEIDFTSDSFMLIKDCFTIERRNKTTLFIKLDENNTGSERSVTVVLEAGDYFDYITIRQ